MNFREIFTDAIRYWEFRRIVYNAVLALIAGGILVYSLSHASGPIEPQKIAYLICTFFITAVVANVCYSIIYIPDLIVQVSQFREIWLKFRWIFFFVGLAFAALLTPIVTVTIVHG